VRTAVVLGTNLLVGGAGLAYVLARFGQPALGLLGGRVSPALLAAFTATVALAFLGYALRWRMLLAGLGAPRALGWLTAYRAAGQSLSALIPSAKLGGEPLRAYLLLRDGVPGATAIASVAVDRTLEMGAGAAFACLFAALLIQRGVPALEGAFVSVTLGAAALALGIAVSVRRLRRRSGVVTAVARATGLDRLQVVQARLDVLGEAEEAARALVAQPGRLGRAFGMGLAVNLLVLVEYHLLLAAFGLPDGPLAVVAAVFATGAAHSLPVPAAVGTLEGAQMFLFGTLGHPPEVGLAVGLAVRLRELVWIAPGLVYLLVRGVARAARAAT
jgi:uncharacterized protein (TIRG00374 family)